MMVVFYTSNAGKVEHLRRLLSACWIDVVHLQPRSPPPESAVACQNALAKAIAGSRDTDSLVLASDEEIYIPALPESEQPNARVRRVAGADASDEDMVRHYERLLQPLPDGRAVITTHFSAAQRGTQLGSMSAATECILRLPPLPEWPRGRPLAAFHFVADMNEYYLRLTPGQLAVVERRLSAELCEFLAQIGSS